MLVGRRDSSYYHIKNTLKTSIAPSGELEERLAAKHQGYNWNDYQKLYGADCWILSDDMVQDSKSAVLARYRAMSRMDSIINDVNIQEAKRKK